MAIINEQNILGNPELANALRPGTGNSAANYAFGNSRPEMQMYEMMGNARGTSWTQPKNYAPEVDVAEATSATVANEAGPAGEVLLSSPTQYGNTGGQPQTENQVNKTPLSQVGEVLGGTKEAEAPIVNPHAEAIKSETIKTEGRQGPVASGGHFNGYEATNQYYIQTLASGNETVTQPAPIEDTGIKSVIPDNGGYPANVAGSAASPGGDNPQANRGAARRAPMQPRPAKPTVTGQSAQKPATMQPRPAIGPGGPGGLGGDEPATMQPRPLKVHKPSGMPDFAL
tara:strand:- start:64 stop:918 length:855 start_codon:yes stop_codon:yes gene_type:complete